MGKTRAAMLEAVAITYGMLLSFVLSGASRNRKLARPNPPVLSCIGYVLLGGTCTASVSLACYAIWTLAGGAAS